MYDTLYSLAKKTVVTVWDFVWISMSVCMLLHVLLRNTAEISIVGINQISRCRILSIWDNCTIKNVNLKRTQFRVKEFYSYEKDLVFRFCVKDLIFICRLSKVCSFFSSVYLLFFYINFSFFFIPFNTMFEISEWSSIGPSLASMTSRRQIQDGGPHTSDQRWRPPRRQIQDGGPHDFRSKIAAPTAWDPRWWPHEVRYKMAVPVTRSVTPRRVSQRPRPREGSVTS